MTATDQFQSHNTDPVQRRIGTACGISLEIRRTPAGDLALVASPTTDGQHVVMKGPEADLEILELLGQSMLNLFRLTGPLLTGEHFRTCGPLASFGV